MKTLRLTETVALAGNAFDNQIPPKFIFSQKTFNAHFIRDGHSGLIGTGKGLDWIKIYDFLARFLEKLKNNNLANQTTMLLTKLKILQPIDKELRLDKLKPLLATILMRGNPEKVMTV